MSWDDIDLPHLARRFSYYNRRALAKSAKITDIAEEHEVNAVELRDAIFSEKQRLGLD
jgi:hypothetical protein